MGRQLRQHVLPITAAFVAAEATLAVASVSHVDFAYRAPALHIALETAAFLVALLASFLVFGRFRRSAAACDLVLVCALAALAGANLVAVCAAVADGPSRFAVWAPIAGRVLGSGLFCAAAFLPDTRLRRPRATATRALSALGVILLGITVVIATAGARLPVGVETQLAGDPGRPDLAGHPIVLGVQIVTMALFAAAAIGFSVRSMRTGDELMRWLAVGAVFACFARVNYFLYPSLYSDWVYTGDVFRLLFYGTLLVGAAREIRSYWEGAARSAVIEERQRIGRDLHDGAAQELAYVLRRLRALRGVDDRYLRPIVEAAERGLDDSRNAIAALAPPLDAPFDGALEQALHVVSARTGVGLALDLAKDVDIRPEMQDDLIRIACEAVANAAQHSGSGIVRVALANGNGIRLRVEDDGVGFDRAVVKPGRHFGLVGMSERARSLGGRLSIESAPGRGTSVEVTVDGR
jgi:signal transduction histidine kinase